MATIQRFEDLEIWQEARRLSKEIIEISEKTGLMSDFRFIQQISKRIAGFIHYLNKKDFKGNKFK